MGKYYNEVIQRAIQKRKELENDPAAQEADFLNMQTTAKVLSNMQTFMKYPRGLALVFLKFLGYTDVEMMEVYSQLVFEQSTEKPDEKPAYPIEDLFPDPKRIPKPTPEPYPELNYDWIYDCDDDQDEEEDDEPDDKPDPIPKVMPLEKVWQYYETSQGEIFRTCRGSNFQLLEGGEWVDCRSLMSYYYDAASNYWEIREEYVRNIIRKQK